MNNIYTIIIVQIIIVVLTLNPVVGILGPVCIISANYGSVCKRCITYENNIANCISMIVQHTAFCDYFLNYALLVCASIINGNHSKAYNCIYRNRLHTTIQFVPLKSFRTR